MEKILYGQYTKEFREELRSRGCDSGKGESRCSDAAKNFFMWYPLLTRFPSCEKRIIYVF